MLEFLTSIMTSLGELAMSVGMKLIYAIVLLVIGFKVSSSLCKKLEKSKGFAKVDESISKFLLSILNFALKAIILKTKFTIPSLPTA